jgi:DNA-directed RNA polymerase specialized sigma24 family protein
MGRAFGRKGWTRLVDGVLLVRGREAGAGASVDLSASIRDAAGSAGAQEGPWGDALSRLAMLERAVGRLPLFEREVWWLAARDDLTVQEIADRLAIGVEEADAYFASALAALAGGQGSG